MNATADNPYLLLTPGPLTTSTAVKESMLRDWCTWDDEYKELVQDIRRRLVLLTGNLDTFTSVLMQGSGTFSVESVLTSAIPRNGKLLVLVNGAFVLAAYLLREPIAEILRHAAHPEYIWWVAAIVALDSVGAAAFARQPRRRPAVPGPPWRRARATA